MNSQQRVRAALRGEAVDRAPFSVYVHSKVHNRGVKEFAEFTLAFHRRFRPDYVKAMYDENYDTPVNFQFATDPSVWDRLEELDPHRGGFGRQLELLKIIRDAVGAGHAGDPDPLLALPLGRSAGLAHPSGALELEPERVQRGLGVIARNVAAFGRCALEEAGIDGFMFAAYGCESSWLSQDGYRALAMPDDRAVIAALLRPGALLMLHIHGERGSYFDLLKDYDVDALSWEDRLAGPSLAEARRRTEKCLIGGVDHLRAVTAGPDEVRAEALDAIRQTGGRGFILAPGCTFPDSTPEANLSAVGEAAKSAAIAG